MKSIILFSLLTLAYIVINAQTLSGNIFDKNGEPIPYATIFIKELNMGTTSNSDGAYQLNLSQGTYTLQFRSIGFEQTNLNVTIDSINIVRDVVLPEQTYQLHEIRVYKDNIDPAYPIMRRVVAMAPFYLNCVKNYNANVYLKGTAKIEKVPKIMQKQFKASVNGSTMGIGDVYVGESISEIEFNAPDVYHQKIISSNMSIVSAQTPTFDMGLITESPYQPIISNDIISPLSPKAFANYNFKYEGFYNEGGYLVNKIRVIPKRNSKQLLSGYLYVIDGLWCLHGSDLLLDQGYFNIKIDIQLAEVETGTFMPISHALDIRGGMMGIAGSANYTSSIKYKTLTKNDELKIPELLQEYYRDEQVKDEQVTQENKTKRERKIEEIMAKDELSTTDAVRLARLMKKESEGKEPVKKDSYEIVQTYHVDKADSATMRNDEYWQLMRPNPLSVEELKSYAKSDSLASIPVVVADTTTSEKGKKHYVSKVLGEKNLKFKSDSIRLKISSLLAPQLISFNAVEGLKYRQTIAYMQHFRSGKKLNTNGWLGYSFSRRELQWNVDGDFGFAPLKLGHLKMSCGNNVVDYMPNLGVSPFANTVSSLFFKENYARYGKQQYVSLLAEYEVINGMVLSGGLGWFNRQHLQNATNFSFFYRDETYHSNEIYTPEGNHINVSSESSAIFNCSLEYTPERYYKISKGEKIPAESAWPTFKLTYKKGVEGIWGSSSKWDYLELGIHQTVKLGINSEINYSARAGHFLDNTFVAFADYAGIDVSSMPVEVRSISSSFKFLPYYSYNTNRQFATMGVNYKTPNLALKYLPWFCTRSWNENLYLNYLLMPGLNNYVEMGYSISKLLLGGEVGIYGSFENGSYRQTGIRATFLF